MRWQICHFKAVNICYLKWQWIFHFLSRCSLSYITAKTFTYITAKTFTYITAKNFTYITAKTFTGLDFIWVARWVTYKKQELLTRRKHLRVFFKESVLLIFLVFCVVLLCVFTFLFPCFDVRYDSRINKMFGSSLHPIVCRIVHVLFTLFELVYV